MALAQVSSPIAYGAPIMSGVVTVGFIVVLTLFVSYSLQLDAYQQSVVTILIGYLGAAFQQAVNYWLGTTRQSREMDTVLASLAGAVTATRAREATVVIDAMTPILSNSLQNVLPPRIVVTARQSVAMQTWRPIQSPGRLLHRLGLVLAPALLGRSRRLSLALVMG